MNIIGICRLLSITWAILNLFLLLMLLFLNMDNQVLCESPNIAQL